MVGGMAQWIRTLAAPAEDLGLVPSIHRLAHSSRESDALLALIVTVYTWYMDTMQAKHSDTQNKNKENMKFGGRVGAKGKFEKKNLGDALIKLIIAL